MQLPTRFYMPSGSRSCRAKRTYEDQLPNPFGGDPLPAQSSLTLREVQRQREVVVGGHFHRSHESRSDPRGLVRAYARKLGQPLRKEAAVFDAIEDAATYVYDLASGIRAASSRARRSWPERGRVDSQRYDVTLPQKK
jgi:hypothetical protein